MALPGQKDMSTARREIIASFDEALTPVGLLDHFKVVGVIARWWNNAWDELRVIAERGFSELVDGWVLTICDFVQGGDDEDNFDPFDHKLVRATIRDYLDKIEQAKSEVARLKSEKEAFEQDNAPEGADDDELKDWNQAKSLEGKIKLIKTVHKTELRQLSRLETAAMKKAAKPADLADHRKASKDLVEVTSELAALEQALLPYAKLKDQLTAARAQYRALTNDFVGVLRSRCDLLSDDEKQQLVLSLFLQEIQLGLAAAALERRQQVLRFCNKLVGKYLLTVGDLRERQRATDKALAKHLTSLGYQ
jgi:type I restriction enzyme M protein